MTLADVAEIALSLPGVSETTKWRHRTWTVAGKGFCWERPLNKADIRRLAGAPAPDGPILGVRTAGLEAKAVLLMTRGDAYFSIEHFRGYPAVLVQLAKADRAGLEEVIADGWFACAPPALARELASRRP